MSIWMIVLGVLAALVLMGIFGSIVGRRLREVGGAYPVVGGDDE